MNIPERGYAFALPRLLIRIAGKKARRAEFSGVEVYTVGLFVFCYACVIAGHRLLVFVRPTLLQILVVLVLPFAVWIGFLLLYFFNWLLAQALRHLGLYSARTNNPLQHLMIISLLTYFALSLLRDPNVVLRSLGIFWLGLIGLNLFALFALKLLHER